MQISSVSFDGMHRSGKGSQIKSLRERLNLLKINNIGVRGEYYRKGSGNNNLEDPYSKRWQDNQYNENYSEKSNRLNRELYILHKRAYLNFIIKNKINKGIIIQDRSIVGNYLFHSGEGRKVNNLDYFDYGKNKGQFINKVIIPDLIFILQPSKNELLERLYSAYNKNEDNAKLRLKYKEQYIQEKYEKYYNGINTLPEEIKNNTIVIFGDSSKEEIQEIVFKNIQENFKWISFSGK